MTRDAGHVRREEDLRRLRELIRHSDGRIRLVGATGDPVDRIRLILNYRTVPSAQYPKDSRQETEVDIRVPARYPFVAPKITIKTPIFHPNVYQSGLVCLGDTWIPTEGLDLLVRRLIRLITFDPLVSGGMPPANQMASSWYHRMRRQSPVFFPTEAVEFKERPVKSRISFESQASHETPAASRVVRACPACASSLRLPQGQSGSVRCPACAHLFETRT